jgi:hypothetical protein
MSSTLQYKYRFIDYAAFPPVHQGTGDITYSPTLVVPASVPGDVSDPLAFSTPSCGVFVLCMTIDTPQGPNWYGIACRKGIQSFSSVNVFCHPHPGHAGMRDSDYQSRGGEWRSLFRYAQNLGFQFAAANSDQILVVPFFSNASYHSGGIFAPNWKEILSIIVNGLKVAIPVGPAARTAIDLEAFEQALRDRKPLPVAVQNVVLSCFSFGRTLMWTLRRNMPGLQGSLREVWDFDGSGASAPSSGGGVRAIVYDVAVSNSSFAFHVPKQRWTKFWPAQNAPLHGFIPNMLMWHAATMSGIGR